MSDAIRFGARLRAARKAAGFKTSLSFTRKYKIPQSTYSQHESGTRNPDEQAMKNYSKCLGVRYEWLNNGDGLPYTKINTNQKTVMQEELLDIKPMSKSTQLVEIDHQELLVKILDELIRFNDKQKHKLNISKIVSDAVALYQDIVSSGENRSAQLKMVIPAMNAYKRLMQK